MQHDTQHFSVHHRGELREALIMVEGDNGGFELLAHGSVPLGAIRLDWASVRSSSSDAEYLFIHDREHRPGAPTCWHIASEVERDAVRGAAFRS